MIVVCQETLSDFMFYAFAMTIIMGFLTYRLVSKGLDHFFHVHKVDTYARHMKDVIPVIESAGSRIMDGIETVETHSFITAMTETVGDFVMGMTSSIVPDLAWYYNSVNTTSKISKGVQSVLSIASNYIRKIRNPEPSIQPVQFARACPVDYPIEVSSTKQSCPFINRTECETEFPITNMYCFNPCEKMELNSDFLPQFTQRKSMDYFTMIEPIIDSTCTMISLMQSDLDKTKNQRMECGFRRLCDYFNTEMNHPVMNKWTDKANTIMQLILSGDATGVKQLIRSLTDEFSQDSENLNQIVREYVSDPSKDHIIKNIFTTIVEMINTGNVDNVRLTMLYIELFRAYDMI